jgi:hypothetical protein
VPQWAREITGKAPLDKKLRALPATGKWTLAIIMVVGSAAVFTMAQNSPAWPQWGQNSQHTGLLPVPGQAPKAKLADQVFDPFVA